MNPVAKILKIGSKLPAQRRPFLIPVALLTKELVEAIEIHCKSPHSNECGIDPIDAKELLLKLDDNFVSRKLKQSFIQELNLRLERAKTLNSKRSLTGLIDWLTQTKIGTYDWASDEQFIQKMKQAGLGLIVNLADKRTSWKRNIQKVQNLEIII